MCVIVDTVSKYTTISLELSLICTVIRKISTEIFISLIKALLRNLIRHKIMRWEGWNMFEGKMVLCEVSETESIYQSLGDYMPCGRV